MPIKTSSDKSVRKIYGNTTGKIQRQSKVPPIDFHAKTGLAVEYSMSGNMTQASTQEYSITDIPPIDFQSDGSGISAYSIYGNMQQIGQPAPDAPIIPEECGDRTENLFYPSATQSSGSTLNIRQTEGVSEVVLNKSVSASDTSTNVTIDITLQAGTYKISVDGLNVLSASYDRCFLRDTDNNVIVNDIQTNRPKTFTISETVKLNRLTIVADAESVYTNTTVRIMLNTGDTALPYEPYGYKIPVTNEGTTTNIYALEPIRKIGDYADVVGSSGTVTRYVKKLVLTGTENWQLQSINQYGIANYYITIAGFSVNYSFCTHLVRQSTLISQTTTEGYMLAPATTLYVRISETRAADVMAWKNYLAQQYTNGTPVTVWYVLANPTTEQITSPTITTVSGANTLSIGTTLQPSSASLTTSSSVYPLNPIIPEECGDRTGNLVPPLTEWVDGYIDGGTGTIHEQSAAQEKTSPFINIKDVPRNNYLYMQYEGGDFPNGGSGSVWTCIGYYDNNKVFISRPTSGGEGSVKQYTMPENAAYCRASFRTYGETGNISLSSGTEPPSYEPYGYKIPLNLNNTISNIYLSQPIRKIGNYSDSIDYEKGTVTRKIKKLVLTGEERVGGSKTNGYSILVTDSENAPTYCTHFAFQNISSWDELQNGCISNTISRFFRIKYTDCEDTTAFKSYLETQYANGNPVTVWYVLATAEVEQITPPTLTPSIESNTLSVDTTLQPSNLSITYTSPDYSEIKLVYDNQGNILYNDPPYHDWGAVRWIVRQGLGPQYYPIGYIFYDNFNSSTGTAYQVVAHNHHFDPNLTALGYTYSMTCLEVNLNDYMIFDNTEAFLYTDTIIPAGTYRFTIPNYDATYGGNKTYYFTSTADLPAGSQIVMNWPYNQTPKTVTAYSPSGTTTVQTITTATTGWNGLTLTEYVDGTSPTATDLGTIAGPSTQLGTSNYGEMNHIHRARYGSNNYLQSGIRQYLNSNSAANTWWQPQTIFDRPYGGRTSAGKLTKLNQNLVDVLATPTIQSRTNSYFETTSLDGTTFSLSTNYDITTDKLFLLSPMEINFSTTDTTVGTVLDYYVGATDTDRIKIRTSTEAAGIWWLRTPYPSDASPVRLVGTSGALGYGYARNSYGCAPAWVIQ